MKRYFYIVTVLLFAVALYSPLFAADSPLNLAGNGARAAGMGYAFTGVADDATAISWNAAGLTQLYSMEASVIARFGFGSYSFDNLDYPPEVEYGSQFQLNFASFVFPFTIGKFNIVGGVAYRTIYDFNQELTFSFQGYDGTISSEGGVKAISPSVGIQLNDMFSVGTTVNIYTGSQTTSQSGNLFDSDQESTSDYSGLSFDVGVLFRPNSRFSIGANFNFPNELTETTEGVETTFKVPFFFSIGGAFRATDQLLLTFDYFKRDWSNSDDLQDIPNPDIYDLNSIHVGLEYLITSGNAVLPVRLGFFTNPQYGLEDKNQDQVVNNVFTAGLGIVMKNFIIDGAIEFEPASYDEGDPDLGEYTINEKLFRVTIGATIHFGQE